MNDATEGVRIYAVGDIHGRLDLLIEMLGRILNDLRWRPHPKPQVIFLGDYIDRGPESRGVLDLLIDVKASDLPARFLLGNHDTFVGAYLHDPGWLDHSLHWLHGNLGGLQTLASYGISDAFSESPRAIHEAFAAAFPAEHSAFLERCELMVRIGDYVFVHAGIRPGVPLEAQDPEDLIWIREPFLSSTEDFGFKVVHGHTIVRQVEHHPNRIAVDTGAFRTGQLSCVVLQGRLVMLLMPEEAVPLPEGAGIEHLPLWKTLRARK